MVTSFILPKSKINILFLTTVTWRTSAKQHIFRSKQLIASRFETPGSEDMKKLIVFLSLFFVSVAMAEERTALDAAHDALGDFVNCDVNRAVSKTPLFNDRWNGGHVVPVNAIHIEVGANLRLDFVGPETGPGFPADAASELKNAEVGRTPNGLLRRVKTEKGSLIRAEVRWEKAAVIFDVSSGKGVLLSADESVKPVALKNCHHGNYSTDYNGGWMIPIPSWP
jgi:hypothetical protein